MRVRKLVILVCMILLLGALPGSAAFGAPATQEPAVTYPFEGGVCGDSVVLEAGEQGNKTFLKLFNTAVMVSEDPRLAGPVTVEVEVLINNVNGHINGHGSLVLEPTGYDGTWEADFNIHAPGGKVVELDWTDFVKDSQMNARGTGEFEGMWFLFAHGFPVFAPLDEVPVESPDPSCVYEGEVWAGRILDPNA